MMRHDAFAQTVRRAFQFLTDLLQTVLEQTFFFFRKMQSLRGGIRKETVCLDLTCQCCALDQIGVEKQTQSLGAGTFFHDGFHHLSRGKAGHRPLLIIVCLFAVADVSAACVFQKQRIHSIMYGEVCGPSCSVFQIYNTDQRMPVGQTKQLAILIYRVQSDYLFCHTAFFFFIAKIHISRIWKKSFQIEIRNPGTFFLNLSTNFLCFLNYFCLRQMQTVGIESVFVINKRENKNRINNKEES